MENKNLIDYVLEQALEKGFDDGEVYIARTKNLSLKLFESEIDTYTIADNVGLSFRGTINQKIGYAYTERLDQGSMDQVIEHAKENARSIDSDDQEIILENRDYEYKTINNYCENLYHLGTREKIELLKAIEKYAFSLDERVKSINYNQYGETISEIQLVNSKGIDLYEKSNVGYFYISVIVERNEDIQSASHYFYGNDLGDFNYKEMTEIAVNKALNLLDARSIESKNVTTLIKNEAFASLIGAFSSNFSAENIQKGSSLLQGKLGETIASEQLTVLDNPLLDHQIISRSFDGEGAPTRCKKIIDNGILTQVLHNKKTATKAGVEDFGNAGRHSYKSKVDVAPSNFYVEKGEQTYEQLIESIDEGIIITDVQGLHAGLDAISGDFSLAAKGFLINDGQRKQPVNQITVSGNFYEMIKDIIAIGSDLQFKLPGGQSCFGSPSVVIDQLTISGK